MTRRGGALSRRNGALVALFALCGLRVEEALGLTTEDVSTTEAILFVRVGEAPRTVTLSPLAIEALDAWLVERRALPDQREGALFVTRAGTRLSSQYLRRLLPRLARQTGLPAPVSAETLRRAHAADLVRRGWPLHDIQKRLGYGTLTSTRRFLSQAGLVVPDDTAEHSLAADFLMQGPTPCRTCLHSDGLESGSVLRLLDRAADAALVTDHAGTIRGANATAEILFGVGRGGLEGRSLLGLLHDRQETGIVEACRECLATRRPTWAIEGYSSFSETPVLVRAIPATRGITLWLRDDLGLSGLPGLVHRLSALAHGSSPGTTLVVRAVRDTSRQIVDFVVAAADETRSSALFSDAPEVERQRISEVLPHDMLPELLDRLRRALALRRSTRMLVHVKAPDDARRPVTVRIVPFASDWLVVAIQDNPGR